MIKRLTFNQALGMAQTVDCLVRGPDSLVPITISKAAARRFYAPSVKAYKATPATSQLDGSLFWEAEDPDAGHTLWTFDPADRTLLIG